MRSIIALFLNMICSISMTNAMNDRLIPREILFGNPEKTSVSISHDGKYVSFLAPKDGVLNIWLASIETPNAATPITQDNDRGIRSYTWSYDNQNIIFAQDEKGDENFRLYAYNLNTSQTTLLTPKRDVKALIYEMSPHRPTEILIGMNSRSKSHFDVYKVNMLDYKVSLVMQNDEFVKFVTDSNLDIRLASKAREDGGFDYYKLNDNKWSLFFEISGEDGNTSDIIGFSDDKSKIYLIDSRDHDKAVLSLLDVDTSSCQVLAQDDKADISIAAVEPMTGKIQAVVANYERPVVSSIDKSIDQDLEFLKSQNLGMFSIVSRTLNDKLWMISYTSDVSFPKYYIYDRSKKKIDFLFDSKPQASEYEFAPMEPVIIKSRDGLDMVSYLTLPKQRDGKVPMVLYVHGGPHARDVFGFNGVHQWLANRGYAVLSVNYRGSAGFGKKFINAGNRQWGLKMHDDLLDSVNYMVESGVVDHKRICIMGGSYGGYATLVGLTFTPNIFACGVDIVGPSNLVTLGQSIPPYWKPLLANFKKRMGDWETEEGRRDLLARSPITFVDNIKKPLLIAQGAHDPRVKKAESDQIVRAMKQKDIPVIYALCNNEGHGFANPKNRVFFYAITEQFLSKILGGKFEDLDKNFSGAEFTINGIKNPSNDAIQSILHGSIKTLINHNS